MKTILLATNNQGKLVSMQWVLSDLDIELKTMADVGLADLEIDESASTLEGNAIIKAMTVGEISGEMVVSDDAGLFVDALPGKLGVQSKRYAPGTDTDRNKKLLKELKNVPKEERTARFMAVNVCYDPATKKVLISHGTAEGEILTKPRGEHGFGYDPVFLSHDTGRSFAEMDEEEIATYSHRARSMKKMEELLSSTQQ